MMFMFPFLFGAMFGDLGQGIVLALLGGLLVSKRVKALRGMAGLGGVILACGLVASVFGILYGSFFGFEEVIQPLWMAPVKNILTILEIAIGAGVILLSLGYILGVINAWTARDWPKLLFEHSGLPGLLLYWSLLGIGATFLLPNFPVSRIVFIILAVIMVVIVAFSEVWKHLFEGHRPLIEDNIFIYLIQVFFEMLEVMISYLSNSLSYVRVGAFAVAHGGLSAAIFILAELVGGGGHGIGYWIVVVLGNLFIVGFEGLIVGIQTMRLSYYEFFSKFFTGGGTKYEPLSIRPTANE
jgi:V/A-type H+-transporting ATPase subunit I